jgi:putative ABC transport system ATP-binding protein
VTSASLLRADRLSRIADGKRIVDRVSVEVARGEVLAIVGQSGSGKSTFLRMLNRLDEPDEGTVLLDGVDYRTLPPRALRRRVGLVIQAPHLFPGTIADNVGFGPAQRGEAFPAEAIEALLARLGLSGQASRDVSGLSGGEAQRVSLARTLANAPEILLLDEPTSALDEGSRDEVERLVSGLIRERGLTCLIVTHDPAQARRMADRTMHLDNGCVTGIGPARDPA